MNIIFNIDSKKEILLGCTKIEIPEAPVGNIVFYNDSNKISFQLYRMKGYMDKDVDHKTYEKIIFDEIESYVISNAKNLVWSEFEEDVYNKYKSLNEK